MREDIQRKVSNKFVRACAEKRHAEVLLMIALGENVNQFDEGFDNGNGWVAADGNMPNSFKQNGLQMAIRNHDIKLLNILDEAGAKFNFNDHWGKPVNLLKEAGNAGFYEGIKYLHDVKAMALPADYDERGAFLMEVIGGRIAHFDQPDIAESRVALVRYLIEERDFDADYIGPSNERPLTQSAKPGVDHRIMALILDNGVDPNYDSRRANAMRRVEVANDFLEALSKIRNNDDIRNRVNRGFTLPLLQVINDCIVFPSDEIVQEDMEYSNKKIESAQKKLSLLLTHGADPYFANNDGYSAIDFFQDEGNKRIGFGNPELAGKIHRMLDEAAQKIMQGKNNQSSGPEAFL